MFKKQEPVPQGCLDTAVNQVLKGIGHILSKHMLGNDNSIIINSIVKLLYSMFDRLCSQEQLNCQDIAAVLEMTNRLVFVRLGLSILLYKKDANSKVTPLSNPLCCQKKKIDNYKCKGKNDLKGLQVYICLLNVNANHFTLLKINKQTKMIYHYDSIASYKIIYYKIKSTLVRRVAEVSGFGQTIQRQC